MDKLKANIHAEFVIMSAEELAKVMFDFFEVIQCLHVVMKYKSHQSLVLGLLKIKPINIGNTIF